MHAHGFLCAVVNPYHGWNTLQKRSTLGELNIDHLCAIAILSHNIGGLYSTS